MRPLISTGDPRKSVDISRKAELYETSSGMVTITGGKLTTWRRMAKQTVDRIVERDGSDARCVTHEIPLGMAVAPEDLIAAPAALARPARRPLRPPGPRRAGARGRAARSWPSRSSPTAPTCSPRPPTPRAASRRARVGDVLLRRTRLGLTAARGLLAPGAGALERVAAAMGEELGWDAARRAREVEAFREEAREEGILPAP